MAQSEVEEDHKICLGRMFLKKDKMILNFSKVVFT